MQVNILPDQNAESPRTSFDQMGTIVYNSLRYTLGDEHLSVEEINAILKDESMIALPVYAYIHGSVVLNTTGFSCPWDSGQCGAIYISKAKALQDWKRKKMSPKLLQIILNGLRGEVEEFSSYLSGEVYGYQIVDDDGKEIDSCWGFYGYKWAEEAGQEALDAIKKAA